MEALDIRPDIRCIGESSDFGGSCRKCGRPLIILPEDMRQGFCFDCIDFLELSKKQEINEGRLFTVNLKKY
jgi:hypothetical protein